MSQIASSASPKIRPIGRSSESSIRQSLARLGQAAAFLSTRGGLKLLGRVAPERAHEWARRLYFTPQRTRPDAEQHAWLQRAHRLDTRFDGHALAVYVWGEGPVVLLNHGWSGHAGQMTPFVAPLLSAGYKVVAVDMPGHGASAGEQTSFVHFGRALLHVGKLLGPVEAVIAHSGGSPGAAFAQSLGLGARRLVFVAPFSRFDRFVDFFGASYGLSARFMQQTMARGERWLGTSFDKAALAYTAWMRHEPLLVIHCADDRLVPIADGEEITRLWPGARLMRREKLGHLRVLRDLQTVNAAVDFVRGASAAIDRDERTAEAA
jgi:pimeloyl-ACP methyl ester carboxylesterase